MAVKTTFPLEIQESGGKEIIYFAGERTIDFPPCMDCVFITEGMTLVQGTGIVACDERAWS